MQGRGGGTSEHGLIEASSEGRGAGWGEGIASGGVVAPEGWCAEAAAVVPKASRCKRIVHLCPVCAVLLTDEMRT